MRAIYIDSDACKVTEIELPDDDSQLSELQRLVGGNIEFAHEFPNGDVLFVDEEGLLKNPKHFFDVDAHQHFAGNGVIVGPEIEGEPTPAQTLIEDLDVKWAFVLR